jgi:hypothetical protein
MFDWFLNTFGRIIGWVEDEHILKYPVSHYCEQVSPTLWRGSRLETDRDYMNLAKNGFKSMVNLCSENDMDEIPATKYNPYSLAY